MYQRLNRRDLMVLRTLEEHRQRLITLLQSGQPATMLSRLRIAESMTEQGYDVSTAYSNHPLRPSEHPSATTVKIGRVVVRLEAAGLVKKDEYGTAYPTRAGTRYIEKLLEVHGPSPERWPKSLRVTYDPIVDVVHYHVDMIMDPTTAVHGPPTPAMKWIDGYEGDEEE